MKFSVILLWIVSLAVVQLGCSSVENRRNIYSPADDKKPLVDEKYSISADRKKFEEMREQIPTQKKNENDESALILQLTGEVKKSPSDVRSEFDKIVRKKREVLEKDLTKERDLFTKKEKKERDAFLRQQANTRDAFVKEKHPSPERSEFFKESESRRLDYFANERERRSDFESDMRDKRKNFEDYIREKNNEFNQEHRSYTKRFDEMKKQEREQKAIKQKAEFDKTVAAPAVTATAAGKEQQELEQEIEEIKRKMGSPLGSGE